MRVDVAGGGPVGLAFACTLKSMLGDQVSLRVFDRRWKRHGNRITWKSAADGNNRREQVVTLQSNVWAALPAEVQQRLFVDGRFSEMWPLGPDSPAEHGRPRNIKIRWIEDSLLELAQDLGVELLPQGYTVPARWDGLHVLAVADGARSATRESLKLHFGTPSRELFSVDGSALDERVLGIRVVSTKVPDEHTVPPTSPRTRAGEVEGGVVPCRTKRSTSRRPWKWSASSTTTRRVGASAGTTWRTSSRDRRGGVRRTSGCRCPVSFRGNGSSAVPLRSALAGRSLVG